MLSKYWNYNIFVQVLYSYFRYTDRFLDLFFLLLAVILSELHDKSRRKGWVTEHRSTKKNFVRDIIFFAWTPSFLMSFFCFFHVLPPFRLLRFYVEKKNCFREWWEGGGADWYWRFSPPAPCHPPPVFTVLFVKVESNS